ASPATAGSESYVVGQRLSQSRRVIIPAETVIPVRFDEAEKIVVTPEETAPVTLTVAQDIRSSSGTILIPSGSQIEGNLQPTDGGTQFVAQDLILKNSRQRLPIEATSKVITETETIKKGTDTSGILKSAAIGAAAAAVLSDILGDIDLREVLGGAGLGAIAGLLLGGREEAQVVVVYPDTDLDLTLESDLRLN
ncbi:MAG TPA: S-layer homology domain-containing protein, partial [Leptolyngbyaceae cyanobacterium]